MNRSLQTTKTSRALKEQRSLERWAQIRAKGMARFVFSSGLTWGLTMAGTDDILRHILSSTPPEPMSFLMLTLYLLVGIVGGFSGWNYMESTYRNALIESRVNAAPSGNLSSDVLQSDGEPKRILNLDSTP